MDPHTSSQIREDVPVPPAGRAGSPAVVENVEDGARIVEVDAWASAAFRPRDRQLHTRALRALSRSGQDQTKAALDERRHGFAFTRRRGLRLTQQPRIEPNGGAHVSTYRVRQTYVTS